MSENEIFANKKIQEGGLQEKIVSGEKTVECTVCRVVVNF